MESKKKIALAFPHRGEFISELSHLFMACEPAEDYRYLFLTANSTSIPSNRNKLVNTALERDDVEWILQIDSDQVVTSDIPRKMIEVAEEKHYYCSSCDWVSEEREICQKCGNNLEEMDIRVLSAFTFIYKKNLPIPLVPRGEDEGIKSQTLNNSSLIESNRVGTGCLLTHRSVFEEIESPYFLNQMDRKGIREEAEDFLFAKRSSEAGISSYIDMSISVGHKKKINLKDMVTKLDYASQCDSFEEFTEGLSYG